MYNNLLAEMARQKVTKKDIAEILGVAYGTVISKFNGSFSLEDAKKIKEKYFSELHIEYLFEIEVE